MMNLPFVIWMMRSYFLGVPVEVEESALVDGSTRWGVLWRITLPLTLPGLIATATFAFIFSWTEFLFAVSFTQTKAVTVPVVIAGGKKIPELDALQLAFNAIRAGAAGVDMGRNIFQSDSPVGMIRAVKAIVHGGASVEDAYAIYEGQKAAAVR